MIEQEIQEGPWDEDFVEEDSSALDKAAFKRNIKALVKRCEKAEIPFEVEEFEGDQTIRIMLASGRNERPIWIHNLATSQQFLDIEFEKVRFVPKYEAIGCRKKGSPNFLSVLGRRFDFGANLKTLEGRSV